MATGGITPKGPVDPVSGDRHERRGPARERRAPAGAAADVPEDEADDARPTPGRPPGRLDVRV